MYNTRKFLNIAIKEAYKNLGFTFPNPAVGCVLVKEEKIIKKAVTNITGSPHAEAVLFQGLTKSQTDGATLYITLEPCSHYGKNPPCVQYIIDHNIKKVVIGCLDQNRLVSGKGVKELQKNNIAVMIVNDPNAVYLHRYFNFYITHNMPYITAKLAVSIDGKIALKNGHSKWITNQDSRDLVHLMRSQHDAVMTAVGTINTDNPRLNCRIAGYYKDKLIIVLDKNLEISENALIVEKCKESPLWIITSDNVSNRKVELLTRLGVTIYQFSSDVIANKLHIIMEFIAKQGINSIFCEAGSYITELYKNNLINELIVFRSDKILGNDAKAMISNLNLLNLDIQNQIRLIKHKNLYSGDRVEYYQLK